MLRQGRDEWRDSRLTCVNECQNSGSSRSVSPCSEGYCSPYPVSGEDGTVCRALDPGPDVSDLLPVGIHESVDISRVAVGVGDA